MQVFLKAIVFTLSKPCFDVKSMYYVHQCEASCLKVRTIITLGKTRIRVSMANSDNMNEFSNCFTLLLYVMSIFKILWAVMKKARYLTF